MRQIQKRRSGKKTRKTREPLAEGTMKRGKKKQRRRPWSKMSDDEIVSYARKFMKEKGISGRYELRKADYGLYQALCKRKLLDKLGFEEKLRDWASMSDDKLVSYAKRVMKEEGIKRRTELEKADKGLYQVLRIRKLLDKVGFEKKTRPRGFFPKMSDDELVAYAKEVMKEKGISGRGELAKADGGLYKALQKRKLFGRVGFEKKTRPRGFFPKMSDDELIVYAKKFMKEKGISGRGELKEADGGLYDALWKRKLLDKLGFEEKIRPRGFFPKMGDDELVAYAKEIIEEKGIRGRYELEKADSGLYDALRKRKLLDHAFASIEKAKQRQADDEVIRVLEEFGGAE